MSTVTAHHAIAVGVALEVRRSLPELTSSSAGLLATDIVDGYLLDPAVLPQLTELVAQLWAARLDGSATTLELAPCDLTAGRALADAIEAEWMRSCAAVDNRNVGHVVVDVIRDPANRALVLRAIGEGG